MQTRTHSNTTCKIGALAALLTLATGMLAVLTHRAQADGRGGQTTQKSAIAGKQQFQDKFHKPDLVIADVVGDYKWDGSKMARVSNAVWIEVYNRGNAAAGETLLVFQWGGGDYTQNFYTVPKVEPGHGTWLLVSSHYLNPYTKKWEDYNLWKFGAYWDVFADCDDFIPELNEENNSYTYFSQSLPISFP